MACIALLTWPSYTGLSLRESGSTVVTYSDARKLRPCTDRIWRWTPMPHMILGRDMTRQYLLRWLHTSPLQSGRMAARLMIPGARLSSHQRPHSCGGRRPGWSQPFLATGSCRHRRCQQHSQDTALLPWRRACKTATISAPTQCDEAHKLQIFDKKTSDLEELGPGVSSCVMRFIMEPQRRPRAASGQLGLVW